MPGTKEEYLHPVFVWWHTLSHRLITALSVDSGYSSAGSENESIPLQLTIKQQEVCCFTLLNRAATGHWED